MTTTIKRPIKITNFALSKAPKFFLLFTILLVSLLKIAAASENAGALTKNCGKLDLIPTDVRTFAPWTVAIFRKVSGGSKARSRWEFHTSGSIFGTGLVASVQAGPPGRFPSDKDPRNFLVAAGVNTSDFSKHDDFAQYSRVTFIQPYESTRAFESYSHEVVYHLETPLNFSTPYVKANCLPHFAENPKSQFISNLRTALSAVKFSYVHSGFASGKISASRSNTDDREWTLKVWKFVTLPADVCASVFRLYYGHSLSPLCSMKTESGATSFFGGTQVLDKLQVPIEYSQHDDELCFGHGSRSNVFIGGTWYAGSAAVSVIPGLKRQRCGPKTVYFGFNRDPIDGSRLLKLTVNSVMCGADNFSCVSSNPSQCIPLYRTCDRNPDCDDSSDEHPDICFWKTGHDDEETKTKPDTSLRINIELDARDVTRKCPAFHFILDGVRCLNSETLEDVSCTSTFYPGRKIRVQCAHFYHTPKFSFDHMNLFCNHNGEWTGLRPIYCHKECGILDEINYPGKNFPWDVTILENGAEICRGTLIQPTFVLTDGRCVKKWAEAEPKGRSTLKVSLTDDFVSGHDKVEKFEIKKSWISSASNNKYEAGIALIQLDKPAKQTAGNLSSSTTACFLVPPFNTTLTNQRARIDRDAVVTVSNSKCDTLENGEICTTLTSNSDDGEEASVKALKRGAGLFSQRLEVSTGRSKHVLQGIFSGETNKEGQKAFKIVDSHADWILDILEANS